MTFTVCIKWITQDRRRTQRQEQRVSDEKKSFATADTDVSMTQNIPGETALKLVHVWCESASPHFNSELVTIWGQEPSILYNGSLKIKWADDTKKQTNKPLKL